MSLVEIPIYLTFLISERNMDEEDVDTKPELTVASQVSFAELCGLLEKISKTHGNEKKKAVLGTFVEKWREFHQELHKDNPDTVSREGLTFYIPETNLLDIHKQIRP